MTNFQQDNAQNRFAWLTPERALVVLPAAVGVTFALILAGALVVRFQSTINELTALEQERLQKRDDLSFAKIQQRKLKQTYRQSQEQTQLLQQLVTGNQSIETLLSQLNLEASESNVVLESYEPKRTQAAPAGSANSKKNAPPADPLVTDGFAVEDILTLLALLCEDASGDKNPSPPTAAGVVVVAAACGVAATDAETLALDDAALAEVAPAPAGR